MRDKNVVKLWLTNTKAKQQLKMSTTDCVPRPWNCPGREILRVRLTGWPSREQRRGKAPNKPERNQQRPETPHPVPPPSWPPLDPATATGPSLLPHSCPAASRGLYRARRNRPEHTRRLSLKLISGWIAVSLRDEPRGLSGRAADAGRNEHSLLLGGEDVEAAVGQHLVQHLEQRHGHPAGKDVL